MNDETCPRERREEQPETAEPWRDELVRVARWLEERAWAIAAMPWATAGELDAAEAEIDAALAHARSELGLLVARGQHRDK